MKKSLFSRFALIFALAIAPALTWAQNAQVSSYLDSADPAIQGSSLQYTALVANSDVSVPAAGVVLTMTVPSGSTFVSATFGPSNSACTGPVASVVTCTIGALPASADTVASGAVEAILTVKPNAALPATITTTATITSTTDTNPSDNTLTQTTTLIAGADISMAASVAATPIVAGTNATFTFTPTNLGVSDAVDSEIDITLQAGLTGVSASGSGWTCTGSGPYVCKRALASAGALPAITVVAKTTAVGGPYTATATSVDTSTIFSTPDPVSGNNAASTAVSTTTGSDVTISGSGAPSTLASGANATFTFSVSNAGPSNAATPVAAITLPAGWTYVSTTAANYTCDASLLPVITCTKTSSQGTGAATTIAIVATAPSVASTTSYTANATVSTTTAESNTGNNSGSATVSVMQDGTDLQINTLTAQGSNTPTAATPVVIGDTIVHTISVTNLGPRAATSNVQISLEIAANETYVNASGTNWSCVLSGSTHVLCTSSASLALNATTSLLTVNTTANAAGTAAINACTGGSTPTSGTVAAGQPINGTNNLDPNASNNCSNTPQVEVSAGSANLSITVATTTPTGGDKTVTVSEASATYTINAVNNGPSSSDHVSFTFNIPGYISGQTGVVITPAAGFTCTAPASTITCTENNGDTMPNGDSRFFTVVASRAMNDTWNNNTPRATATATATATITSSTVGDPNRAGTANSGSDTVTIDPMTDISFAATTYSANPVKANVSETYTLHLVNSGPSVAEGIALTMDFDRTDFTFTSATPSGITGLTCAYNSGPNTVTCSGANSKFPVGNATIAVVILPAFAPGEPIRTMSSNLTVSTTTPETNAANNTGTAALQIIASDADILLNLNDSPLAPYNAGPDPLGYDPVTVANDQIIYYSKAQNLGPSLATNVKLSSTYTPSRAGRNYTFLGVSTTAGGAYSAASCTNPIGSTGSTLSPLTTDCALANLASGASTILYWKYQIDSSPVVGGETYSNKVVASADETDSNNANNTVTESTTVRSRANIVLTPTPSNPTPNVNQPFNWVVVADNNLGPGLGENIVVTSTVPTGYAIIGTPNWTNLTGSTSGTCAVAGQVVTCPVGNINPTSSATITINNKMTYGGAGSLTPTFTTSSTSDSVDPASANNTNITTTVAINNITVSGRVFLDANSDGLIQAGETTGSSTRTINIAGTDLYGNAISTNATPSANGTYSLAKLPPANASGYTVSMNSSWLASVVPSKTAPSAFTNGGTYTAATPRYTGVIASAPATYPAAVANYDFPYFLKGSIAGNVYEDTNANSVFNSGVDANINGATVNLYDASAPSTVLATMNTPASGAYSFTSLDPYIIYIVRQTLPGTPAGMINGSAQAGTIGGAACASGCTVSLDTPSANTNEISAIDLTNAPASPNAVGFNFGWLGTATISGTIYGDADRSNTQNGAETGMTGVVVELRNGPNCSGSLAASTTSIAAGSYSFTGSSIIVGRQYTICPITPTGYGTSSTPATLTLTTSGSLSNKFGMTTATITALAFSDASTVALSNNGVQNPSELGISGVNFTLTGTDANGAPVNTTVATNASGIASFTGLLTGTYTLAEAQPAGYNQGINTAGNAGGTLSSTDTYTGISPTAGTAHINYVFADVPQASILGQAFWDKNRNGTNDGVDAPKSGVSIGLYTGGTSCAAPGAPLATTSTDAAGIYSFTGLNAGTNYVVCATAPVGWGNVGGLSKAITLSSSGSSANDFALTTASIQALAFSDFSAGANTGNGVQNGGEPGITGVVFTLTGTDASGTSINATLTTAAAGSVSFDGLLSGTYALSEAQPTGYNQGINTAGNAGGSLSSTDNFTGLSVVAGSLHTAYTFAEIPAAAISGTAYWDKNRDGSFTVADVFKGSISIGLYAAGTNCSAPGAAIATTTSSAVDGTYAFSGLSAGTGYVVCATKPIGWGPTGTVGFTVASLGSTGSAGNNLAFTTASIQAKVFSDFSAGALSNNGIQDAGEAGIAGIAMTLTGTDAASTAINATVNTDASGLAVFDGLLTGTYTLSEAQPSGYNQGTNTAGNAGGALTSTDTFTSVSPTAGTLHTAYTFGELPQGSIAGFVFLDTSLDKTKQAGETLLPSISVGLYASGTNCAAPGAAISTTTTDASGAFAFNGASQGLAYQLCVGANLDYSINSSDGSAGNGIALPALTAAGSGGHYFGMAGATLTATMFADANNDGLLNGADAGISGANFTLAGTSASGAAISRSATTLASGIATFADLPAAGAGGYALNQNGANPTVLGSATLNGKTTAGSSGSATAVSTAPAAITSIALASGAASSGHRFAKLMPSNISGRVFSDLNNDGLFNGADSGLGFQTLTITGTSDLGAYSSTATTAADGTYAVSALRPGTYQIDQTSQPAGTANGTTTAGASGGTASNPSGTTSRVAGIVLPTGTSATGYNFAELAAIDVISGKVFADANNNGIADSGETGYPSVSISLTGTDINSAAVSLSTTTDASGNFSFSGLMPGTYQLDQAGQPAGSANGKTTAGTGGGTASNPTAASSRIAGIVLGAAQDSTANAFAEIPANASISGKVFSDANNDGLIQGGEAGIASSTLSLTGTDINGAAVSQTVASDASGNFVFSGLLPGSYKIDQAVPPAGYAAGKATPGTSGGSLTHPTPTSTRIASIALGATVAATGYNLGAIPASNIISGSVFSDYNNDGAQQAGEPGISGIAIALTGTDANSAAVSKTATTDATGAYSFTGLLPGSYQLDQAAQPAATANGKTTAGSAGGAASNPTASTSRIAGIILSGAANSTGNAFAEIPASSSIAGKVFVDANNDGIIQGTEAGVNGSTITLSGTDILGGSVAATSTSDASGNFSFAGLLPGSYQIDQAGQPVGTANGKNAIGTAGGTSSSPTATSSRIAGIVLPAAASASGYGFGELPAANTISGKVFSDANNSGIQDAGEPGIAGSAIALTGTDANGVAVTLSTTSSAGGAFTFANLLPGTYQIDQAAQPASTFNGKTTAGTAGGVASNPTATSSRIAGIVLTGLMDSTGNAFAELPSATLSGSVWYDNGTTATVKDPGDKPLPSWVVEIYNPATSTVIATATTDALGNYSIAGLPPSQDLRLRFRAPGSQSLFGYPVNGETGAPAAPCAATASAIAAGTQSSCQGPNPAISERAIVLQPGAQMAQQSLPVDPSGVVYNSSTRAPVASAIVKLTPAASCAGFDPTLHILNATTGGYTIAGNSISMPTGPDGLYQFYLLPTAPASCDFTLGVVAPSAALVSPSSSIPPQASTLNPPGAAGSTFLVQTQATPPTGSNPTTYYLSVQTGSARPSVIHNHIPLDPAAGLNMALTITKTADKRSAQIGETILYTIAVRQNTGATHAMATILDTLPTGFSFIRGTALLDGAALADPSGNPLPASGQPGSNGARLSFNLGSLAQNQTKTLTYRVRAGAGAALGDMTNRAQAFACATSGAAPASCYAPQSAIALAPDAVYSNVASFKTDIQGGAFGTDTCVLGKVFIDCNGNQAQDSGEIGIPGIRIYLDNGKYAITDSEGLYSMCGLTPVARVAKLDASSAPKNSVWIESSNANFADASSLWLDLKAGMQHRADFIEGSCSASVQAEAKSRAAKGDPASAKRLLEPVQGAKP